MKVYIVERGCYSDRYISGVFSSREKADANIALHGPNGTWNCAGDVEEYEVDKDAEDIERMLFAVEIDLESGEILGCKSHKWFGPPHEKSGEPKVTDFRHMPSSTLSPAFGRLSGEVYSYVSAEHALKLAVELRHAHLRQSEKPEEAS